MFLFDIKSVKPRHQIFVSLCWHNPCLHKFHIVGSYSLVFCIITYYAISLLMNRPLVKHMLMKRPRIVFECLQSAHRFSAIAG